MKIILIILLVFYLLILLTRYLAPILLRYFLKKMGKRFNMTSPSQNSNHQETTFSKKENLKSKKIVGEYIDFEEID